MLPFIIFFSLIAFFMLLIGAFKIIQILQWQPIRKAYAEWEKTLNHIHIVK